MLMLNSGAECSATLTVPSVTGAVEVPSPSPPATRSTRPRPAQSRHYTGVIIVGSVTNAEDDGSVVVVCVPDVLLDIPRRPLHLGVQLVELPGELGVQQGQRLPRPAHTVHRLPVAVN